ncbi:hypothetical protein LCGC14_1309970 [marine sediment metagenome]|uniref:Uncharacterized protein n=1 Tax=marine sediment metagenome TaxID=412755 RepID=A0A0F9L7K7_9ZZZZ
MINHKTRRKTHFTKAMLALSLLPFVVIQIDIASLFKRRSLSHTIEAQ